MSGTIYSGTITTGIVLSDPATQATVTITGTVTNSNANAILGTTAFAWTVNNQGTVASTGTTNSNGVYLLQGGAVNNMVAAGTASPGSLIEGYNAGIVITGASGLATNLGTVEATGTGGTAIEFGDGGQVSNGSALVTHALIAGGSRGVRIGGTTGAVTNFGSVINSSAHADIALVAGGSVVNGASASTVALIASNGGGDGVYVSNGSGAVTNFGTIIGFRGVELDAGGTVTNGQSGSTAATITGTSHNAVIIGGTTGIVTNFGAIRATGTSAAVALVEGGRVTNGSATVTSALITGTGTGIAINGASGTVTNFGTIASTNTRGTAVVLQAGGSVLNEGTITSVATSNSPIYIRSGGSVTNVKNGGTAGGLIEGVTTAIVIRAGAGTVTNSGTIQSTANTGIYLGSGGAITNLTGGLIAGRGNAIFTRGPTAVSNAGVIQATAGSSVYLQFGGSILNKAGALISGPGNAVSSRNAAATVSNSGSIQSSTANGVYLATGGSVTNLKGGFIAGAQNGILSWAVPMSVTNAGIVETTGTSSGIYIRGGGGIVNQAGGTIAGGFAGIRIAEPLNVAITNAGLITGTVGVYNYPFNPGNLTLTNSGTIASSLGTIGVAVVLGNKFLQDVLIVEAGSTFIGAVNGNGNAQVDFMPGGTANMTNVYGFGRILLGDGLNHTLTLTDPNFSGVSGSRITALAANNTGTVNIVSTVNALSVTTGSVVFVGGNATGTGTVTDKFYGGAKNDIFEFSAANLTSADVVAGGGGSNNELLMTTAGTVVATGITGIERFQLATGTVANSLTLTTANFTNIPAAPAHFIRVFGGGSGNTVNASGVTVASDGVVMYGGAGADQLTGGAGNDAFVFTAAALSAGDTVAGGAGTNELLMATAGTINAGGVSGVQSIVLASGGINSLTLTGANFFGVGGNLITVIDGNSGNTVTASTLSSTQSLIVHAGSGADTLTGGAGNDIFYAASNTKMTGGTGTNLFTFSEIGTNTIADFHISGTNEIVFKNSGFDLGIDQGKGTSSPQHLDASLFTTTGFTNVNQRFAYSTSSGVLFYSANGNGGDPISAVATLTDKAALSAGATGNLFFTS